MASGIDTAIDVTVLLSSTANVALGAFRPRSQSTNPGARRAMRIVTAVWVILLPLGAALLLAASSVGLATGKPDAWQGFLTGGIALACWPVAILALRKRRAYDRNLSPCSVDDTIRSE